MSLRRILPLLALLALLFAPFGRMAAAEAMVEPHHASISAAGHCDDRPSSDPDRSRQAVDCLVACAVMAPPAVPALVLQPLLRLAPAASPTPAFSGLHPDADPPPPRFS